MHKKVVSVSLWGNDPRYIQGAVKNSFLSQKHYPDWEFRIYAETRLHDYLKAIPAKVLAPVMEWANGRFWRFAPGFEPDVDAMISRDCDSRISEREATCVAEWIASGKKFHVIRDHERHYDFPMLGGMWGVRGGLPMSIRASVSECANDDTAYLVDQIWLGNKVWQESKAKKDVFIHGAKEKTLITNAGLDFVGQGYDETDAPIYK